MTSVRLVIDQFAPQTQRRQRTRVSIASLPSDRGRARVGDAAFVRDAALRGSPRALRRGARADAVVEPGRRAPRRAANARVAPRAPSVCLVARDAVVPGAAGRLCRRVGILGTSHARFGTSHALRLRALQARGPVPGGRRGGGGGEAKPGPRLDADVRAGDGVFGVRRSARRARIRNGVLHPGRA